MKLSPLHGLVTCGGHSSRMGKDKGLIDYHGTPQYLHAASMLKPFCEQVFISCRAEQASLFQGPFTIIEDDPKFNSFGPIASIASAFNTYPNYAFLTLGCDYPFFAKQDIERLVKARNEMYEAICFCNLVGQVEPLLSVYEFVFRNRLKRQLDKKNYSLLEALQDASIRRIQPENPIAVCDVDTPQDFDNALSWISKTN